MSDYISREEAKKTFRNGTHTVKWAVESGAKTVGDAFALILDEIPAADVVEVVRCKDCKYSEHWYRDKRLCRLWYGEEKPSAPIDVFDDGFCNYGERREDDD